MPSVVDKMKLNRNQDRRARFTDEQVKEMRKMYAKGYTQKAISEIFGASQSTICYIVSEKAHKNLAEYRKVNPPKRRTKEEARIYMRNLRSYKMNIYHIYPKEKVENGEINKNADCTKCIHAHHKSEHIYECDAKIYNIKTLSCYEPRTQKGGAEGEMKEILPSSPFSNGTEYEIFLDNFCYRCKKHKTRDDGFCAFVEQGGCPIENAMEDARFGNPFPSEDIVRIIEDGETKYWNVCKSFETDDAELMKSFQGLFADHPTEKGGEQE